MDEGDFAQLSCIVNSGDEPLTLTWAFHGDQVGPETGITTTNLGPRMSILIINSVGHRHQGKYTCTAKNDAGTSVRTTELNVNGNCDKKSKQKRSLTEDWMYLVVVELHDCLVLFVRF